MLIQRILTALVLIPLVLTGLIFLPNLPFLIITAFIFLAAAWEWSSLMGLTSRRSRILYLLLIAVSLVGISLTSVTWYAPAASGWWVVATIMVFVYPQGQTLWRNRFLRGLMGIAVLAPSWAAINTIRSQATGVYVLLFLLLIIWTADTAAYFAGKQWGKRKLAPKVSPGKSIEGLLGAFAATTLVALLAFHYGDVPVKRWGFGLLLVWFTVFFSVIGDLFESMLKRIVGVKDSGNLLPGHGGLLDRIDSLTAAAPVYLYGVLMLSLYYS